MNEYKLTDWLPTTKKEVEIRGWNELDVIIFSGDAYVDHPSFGAAVIGRVLEKEGLKVAIVPQPNWRDDLRDFKKLGKPRLFFGISAGAMDSMINHYTANKRLRSDDAYTPNGVSGMRPDRTSIVYSNILKKLYPDVPIVLGGIEASLRRITHYDYWDDKLHRSILLDSQADLLVYGMGELPIKEIVGRLNRDASFTDLHDIPQTSYVTDRILQKFDEKDDISLFSHEECETDKLKQAKNFKIVEEQSNMMFASRILQKVSGKVVVVNPPYPPMNEAQVDMSFDLPYTRLPHPKYKDKTIPAFEMIKFSVNMHRGCFGGCSFCTISAHQGKFVVSRSKKSILKEVDEITKMSDFKGYLSDLGGPSANMYGMEGIDKDICAKCRKPSCIYPKICKNIDVDYTKILDIYKSVNSNSKIKKSFIGSGIRYDMGINDVNKAQDYPNIKSSKEYFTEVIANHVSGRLKVAPEHTSSSVLKYMRKADFRQFYSFKKMFDEINQKFNLKQQLIPYFISSHPGCTEIDMAELAVETKKLGFNLEQIQDFTPSPMTLATEIYYTGYHPYTLEKVYTAKTKEEKLAQRQFFFWYDNRYKPQIARTLKRLKREDLLNKLYPYNPNNNSTATKNKKRRN
ncbi:MAG: YgiQ family radical SAM protein [Dysgonomonas sp.]